MPVLPMYVLTHSHCSSFPGDDDQPLDMPTLRYHFQLFHRAHRVIGGNYDFLKVGLRFLGA